MTRNRMVQDVAVREAAISDLAAVLELMTAHAEFEHSRFDPDGKHERLAEFLFGPDRAAICLVATVGSRMVGYSTLNEEFSTWSAAHYLHMDTLFVDADHRNLGIGDLLMAEVKRIADQLGVDQIQWQTPAWNHDAARFYRRHKARAQHKLRFTLEPSIDDGAESDPVSALDVLDAFTHAWEQHDIDGLARTLHHDFVYSASIGPEPGTRYEGKATALTGVELMWAHDAGAVATLGPALEAGDTIVRTWTYRFADRPDEHGIDVFELRDGLIVGKDAFRKTTR